ncbi:MAG TPA: crosslink repair DNA glycosylase YcaQ family protein [Actinomycetes bacterium]|jgi:hypothetical protein|nr:crosslink repair DNA glycosylase YcaQ family protein [Actinomycetes bacterium]
MPDSLSIGQARRLALAAQGLLRAPAARAAGPAAMRAALQRLGAIQVDSINVVARSHELVVASRVGAHDPAAFERLLYRRRAGFEYWGHAASFLPIDSYRWFLPRMRRMAATTRGWWAGVRTEHAELYPKVLARIAEQGPLAASAFREPDAGLRGTWWDWAPAKHVLEDLFDQGVLLVHDRVRFERRYDLAERVLPPGLDVSVPSETEAAVALTVLAARALGVGTAADLADYFRLPPAEARPALAEAVASGLLAEVAVQGWAKPAYLVPGTPVPRGAGARPPVLLSPFDSLIWFRERTERLFGFRYRVEVYVPAAKRRHGYYVMPVLAGDRLVARVDPKHDRPGGRLLLRALTLEDGGDRAEALAATAVAARHLAAHLGAADVEPGEEVEPRLARELAAALAAAGGTGPAAARAATGPLEEDAASG